MIKANNLLKIIVISILLISMCFPLYHTVLFNYDNASFSPYNGTAQNYNPLWRIHNGELPIRDYDDYLGIGVSYFNYLLFLLFGSNFVGSKIAADFAQYIAFIGSCLILGRLIKLSFITTITITALMVCLGSSFFIQDYKLLLMGSESTYGLRTFGPFLLVFFMLLFNINIFDLTYKKSIILGVLTGITVFWSNDYGLTCAIFVCLLMGFLFLIKKNFKITALFYGTTFVSFSIVLLVLGQENFLEFFLYAKDVGPHQFGIHQDLDKTMDRDFWFWKSYTGIFLVFSFIYTFIFALKNKTKESFGLLIIIGTLIFSLTLMEYSYILTDRHTAAVSKITPWIILWVLNNHINFEKIHEKIPKIMQLVFSKLFFIPLSMLIIGFIYNIIPEHKVYPYFPMDINAFSKTKIDEIGGNLFSSSHDIYTKGIEIKDKNIDSFTMTYRTVLAYVANAKSPVRNDYLMHASGPRSLKRYVEDFLKNDSEIAVTLNKEIIGFDAWLERKTWPFYKSLMQKYEPDSIVTFSYIWKKRKKPLEINSEIFSCHKEEIEPNLWAVTYNNPHSEPWYFEVDLKTEFTKRERRIIAVDESQTGLDSMIRAYLRKEWAWDSDRKELLPLILKPGKNTVTYRANYQDKDKFTILDCKYQALWPLKSVRFDDSYFPEQAIIDNVKIIQGEHSVEIRHRDPGKYTFLRIGSSVFFGEHERTIIGIEHDRIYINARFLEDIPIKKNEFNTILVNVKKQNMQPLWDYVDKYKDTIKVQKK